MESTGLPHFNILTFHGAGSGGGGGAAAAAGQRGGGAAAAGLQKHEVRNTSFIFLGPDISFKGGARVVNDTLNRSNKTNPKPLENTYPKPLEQNKP